MDATFSTKCDYFCRSVCTSRRSDYLVTWRFMTRHRHLVIIMPLSTQLLISSEQACPLGCWLPLWRDDTSIHQSIFIQRFNNSCSCNTALHRTFMICASTAPGLADIHRNNPATLLFPVHFSPPLPVLLFQENNCYSTFKSPIIIATSVKALLLFTWCVVAGSFFFSFFFSEWPSVWRVGEWQSTGAGY